MKRWGLFLGALAIGSTVHAVEPYQVMPGMWSCPSGYMIRQGQCHEVSAGAPRVEYGVAAASENGSRQPRECPSGGCAPRYVAPAHRPSVIETYSITGDQGGIGRMPSGIQRHSVTVIR